MQCFLMLCFKLQKYKNNFKYGKKNSCFFENIFQISTHIIQNQFVFLHLKKVKNNVFRRNY